MDCNEARRLVPISIDRELDAQGEAALAAHSESCEACRTVRQQHEAARATIRAGATYHRAPTSLRERIVTALPATNQRHLAAERKFGWQLLTRIGAMVIACAALVLVLVLPRPSVDQRLDDELVASHARAMLTNHVIDIASSDQHTVKPWFNGKVDFSPPVRDLVDRGFPLVGGRLDYVDHRLVAVAVYQRRQHLIDVFIWPAEGGDNDKPTPATSQGYHVVGKTANGMTFRAVSDVDGDELRQFVDLL
jgi:anti-sigma factor RsiW